MSKFNPGDPFPQLKGFSVDHDMIELPGALPEGHYGVVLAYRAHW